MSSVVEADTRPGPSSLRVWLVLAAAVLSISSASVLVRLAVGVHPLAVAFWRTLAVFVLLSPWIRRVERADALRLLAAGACLAVHFSAWFWSLQFTSVMRSTVLVCTSPLWLGILEWVLWRRPPPRRFWGGLALALPGTALLQGDGAGGQAALLGDCLALLGAFMMAIYLLLGRAVRQRVGITVYAPLLAGAAAMVLLPAVVLVGAPLGGYQSGSWLALLALALGPQLIGHNGLNYAVRYVPASTVGAVTLLEPLGATLLAGILLVEWPQPIALVGGGLLGLGAWMALAQSTRSEEQVEGPGVT